jgi:hypothetical protein
VEVDLLGEVGCQVAALNLMAEVEDYREGVKAAPGLVAYLLLCLLFVYRHYKLQLNWIEEQVVLP